MQTKVTAQEIQDAVMASGETYFPVRECSLCGYTLSYQIIEGIPHFDAGCSCVTYRRPPVARTWFDLAQSINIQTNPDIIAEMRKQFHLD